MDAQPPQGESHIPRDGLEAYRRRATVAAIAQGEGGTMDEWQGPLVSKRDISLAIFGMTEGNGHPYSWSAIFNGYDRAEMAKCPFGAIPEYLGKEPPSAFPVCGVRVTHIWCDDPADAQAVARTSLVPNVVDKPEKVIGEVDAVIVATDIGSEHVRRCRAFVEAGLPVFVDKPLVDNEGDLKIFSEWVRSGAAILSSSAMRYYKEYVPYHGGRYHELGELRLVHITMHKKWETYGIHALESVYPIVGPGFLSARNTGSAGRSIVHLKHSSGVDVVVVVIADMLGGSGLHLCGSTGHAALRAQDTFSCFKAQLLAFPFSETQELMKLVIAGIRSGEDGGREVSLDEIRSE
jgi:hypothetical protein